MDFLALISASCRRNIVKARDWELQERALLSKLHALRVALFVTVHLTAPQADIPDPTEGEQLTDASEGERLKLIAKIHQ